MTTVEDHYRDFLASHYTWMSGGFEHKIDDNRRLFESLFAISDRTGKALDLGCGSGFQTLALASLGFNVVAIDSSDLLVHELLNHSTGLQVTGIVADFRDANSYSKYGPFDVAVCMGDTLVHLPSANDVEACIESVHSHLNAGGTLILSFRDLTTELKGIDRAIPVRLDENRLMTTFLEYEPDHVVVNDMLFIRDRGTWTMQKSAYKKLRLAPKQVIELLERTGFQSIQQLTDRGFSTIVAIA